MDMSDRDDDTLLPPAELVHDRLTRNQRERHRLRTLLRLIADQDRPETASDRPQTAAGREDVR
jgi:hypothetical protein